MNMKITEKYCCENFSKCGFLNQHYPDKKGMYWGWVKSFCEDFQKSQDCRRNQYIHKYGVMPPDDMTPEGLYI